MLDGDLPFVASSMAEVDQFNTLLYQASSLDTTQEHNLVIRNIHDSSQASSIDIDYMVVTVGDGNEQYVGYIVIKTRMPAQKDCSVLQKHFADHVRGSDRSAHRVYDRLVFFGRSKLLESECLVTNIC